MAHFVVAGGGIAGLACGIALRKNGHKISIIESASELKPAGAGITLAFNAMKAAKKLAIAEDLKERSQHIAKATIANSKGKPLNTMDFGKYASEFGFSYAIHRSDLQATLLENLSEADIVLGNKVVSFQNSGDKTIVWLSNGQQIETDYLIAADGIHSTIRRQVLPETLPVYHGYTCWRGVTQMPKDYQHTNTLLETWGVGKRLGLVPLINNRIYWFAVSNAVQSDRQLQALSPSELAGRFSAFHPDFRAIIEQTPRDAMIWGDLLDIDPLQQFNFGNTLLVGDAAHATTPNLGQGGCMALEDAAALMSCLEKTNSVNMAFALFEKERLERTATVIKRSRFLGQVGQLKYAFMTPIRNQLMKMTPASAAKKQLKWLNDVNF